jgi:hypothetical protein
LIPLGSDGFRDDQAGRLNRLSGGQKKLKSKLNLKRDYQAAHSGQMVLMVVRQEGWTGRTVAKDAQMRVKK